MAPVGSRYGRPRGGSHVSALVLVKEWRIGQTALTSV